MKEYKIGDVLIRSDREGIRVITRETEKVFLFAEIRYDNTVRECPHNKKIVERNKFYEKLEI